jgi:uncharacterized membrane protein YbhN (UPF0104 family)
MAGKGRGAGGWLAEQVGRPHRLALLVAAAAVLSVGALAGIAWTAGFGRVWKTLVFPHWYWLPIAVAGELVAYLGYTLAYRELARAERGPELDVPSLAALVTTGFGVFVQGGGFALDRAALERTGLSKREARERVLGLGTLEYAVLAPATLAASAFLVATHRSSIDQSVTLSWVIGVPVGGALALLALRHKHVFRRRGWRMHVYSGLAAIGLVFSLFRRPHRAVLAFLGIGTYWIGDIFCLWAALHAFYAHTPPVAQLLVAYATGYSLTRRALPLGGAGVVESLLPFALGWVAIGRAPAVLAVGAYRVINLWLPMLPALAGIPTLRRLKVDSGRRRVSRSRGTA